MPIKMKNKKKIGLVFSGGGVKAAAFHIGVCLALREKGFRFAGGSSDEVKGNYPDDYSKTIRLYVGSSAGAFIASILASGYSLDALISAFYLGESTQDIDQEHSLNTLKPLRYKDLFTINSKGLFSSIPLGLIKKSLIAGSFETILKQHFRINGLFTTHGIEKYLREYALTYNSFHDLGVDLFVVATQLNHTRKVLFGPFAENSKNKFVKFINYAPISEAVASSVSLPPVFAPYSIKRPDGKNMFFFDGEIRDTLSTHVAADHGADLIISSYSIQPYHYTDTIGSLDQFGIPVILNQALYQVIHQKIERHIQHQQDFRQIYNAIDGYFKQNNLPEEHREKVLEIIRHRISYRPEVDYVYIHPRPQDHEMFFADHFSLNKSVLEKIVRIGFKSAIQVLRKYDM